MIYKKLLEIQKELKVPKNQFNKFGGYAFRSAEDILEAAKPLLFERNCIVLISDETNLIGERYYVEATATIIDIDETENNCISVKASAREPEARKGMDDSQITGATSSYARKYALNGLFALDDTKDADATNTHGKDEKSSKKQTVNDAERKKQKVLALEENLNDEKIAKSIEYYSGKYGKEFKTLYDLPEELLDTMAKGIIKEKENAKS